MKKLILSLLLVSGLCHAQLVIPNPELKALLLSSGAMNPIGYTELNGNVVAIDANHNNEIEASEAAVIKRLNLSFNDLSGGIAGLEGFTNLEQLELYMCGIGPTFDATIYPNLKYLNVNFNGLTSLNVWGMGHLIGLDAMTNSLTSINLSGVPNLKSLSLQENQLTSINLAQVPILNNLQLDDNQLTSIDLSVVPQLKSLGVGRNDLTTINVSMLSQLEDFYVNDNQLSSINLGSIPLKNLDCSLNQLTALNIGAMTSLVSLYCASNQLTSLDVSALTNLIFLGSEDNQISVLNVAALTQLETLMCSDNQISVLNVSALTQMEYLNVNNNLLTELNISPLTQLMHLRCANNQIAALNFPVGSPLMTLHADNNLYTSIDFTPVSTLGDASVGGPLLTSIVGDSSNHISFFTISNSPLLTHLELDNFDSLYQFSIGTSALESIDFSGSSASTVSINGANPNLVYINNKNGMLDNNFSSNLLMYAPNLSYLCEDEEDVAYFQDQYPTLQVNSYCSFTPGGINNSITGTVRYDANLDGCDAGDGMTSFMKVKIDDGMTQGASFLNGQSMYNFFAGAATFTLTPQLENPSYFTVTPPTATVTFNDVDGSSAVRNFCIAPNGIHPDAEIMIVPIGVARPGFDAAYKLVFRNKGNQTISGSIAVTFDDARTDFVSASAPITQTGNTLTLTYSNFKPFETRSADFSINLNGPMETPALNQDDILHFFADMTYTVTDIDAYHTTAELNQIVVNSMDPNDKTCLEGNTISPEMIGDYVHYNINFENIGTAPAQNVVVKDAIDATKFDISTLQVIYASHPVVPRVKGNVVEFIFENIELPGISGQNKGNVVFKIKTKPNLVLGNTISNKAEIFFDYNFPIETNEATSTFSLLGSTTFKTDDTISIYPNPARNKVNVKADSNIKSLQLYDMQGRILRTVTENDKEVSVDIANQQTGVYFLNVTTEKGSMVEKLVKQ